MPRYITAREIRERFQVAFETHQADALTEVLTALETERVAELAEIREGLATLVGVTTRLAQAQARTDERLTRVEIAVEKLAEAQTRTEARVEELAQALARTDERLTRVEIAVEKLAQAQTRVEIAVEKLAQALARTDERLTRVEIAVEKLAEAQTRMDERLTRVEIAVEKLAQAQARTEARVEELAQSQARTEARVEELAEAQAKTEVAIQKLSARMDNLAAQIGGLANQFGFSLEEFSQALLPPWLEHYYGITDLQLERSYLKLSSGEYVEADLAGEGKRDNKSLLVLVECHAALGGGETRRLAEKMERAIAQWKDTPRESFRAIVAMNIHPTAIPVAAELGVVLIPYSKINRERF